MGEAVNDVAGRSVPGPSAPGRPTAAMAEAKREAIIAAAAAAFLEQGFGAASMDTIARTAGVSKATIYSHFASKQALFGAIVQGRCGRMIDTTFSAADFAARGPEAALTLIGRQFLDLLLMEGSLPLYRLVLAEAPRFPELGQVFYRTGPDRVAGALAAYLEEQHRRGALTVADPRLAAEQFFGMVLGHLHLKVLLGLLAAPPGPEERARVVATAVATFMHGHRPA